MADWLIVLLILGGLIAQVFVFWYLRKLIKVYKDETVGNFKIIYYMLCDNLWPDKKDKEDNG